MRRIWFLLAVIVCLWPIHAQAQIENGGGTGLPAGATTPAWPFMITETPSGGVAGTPGWTLTQQNTVVVHGGTNALAGTSGFGSTAGNTYIVDAVDTESAALTVTAANVTVMCVPGVTIQQVTASTALFVLGSGANNFTVRNCGLGMPASGTCDASVKDTPATPVNQIVLDNVELNFNSSTCTFTNGGHVLITGGSGHKLNV